MARLSPLIEVESVSKWFGDKRVLHDVSLSVNTGEIVLLQGENGAGKSTLLSMCATILRPDKGDIKLFGESVFLNATRMTCTTGYASQNISLYPDLTVKENVRYFAAMQSTERKPIDLVASRLMAKFGYEHLASKKVEHLSLGQQRIVHVSIAFLGTPRIVLLDEPTAAMDSDATETLLGILKCYTRDGGSVMIATHRLYDIKRLNPTIVDVSRQYYDTAEPPLGFSPFGDEERFQLHFSDALPKTQIEQLQHLNSNIAAIKENSLIVVCNPSSMEVLDCINLLGSQGVSIHAVTKL